MDLGEAARRSLTFPSCLPAIGSLQWDDRGRLWVSDYAISEEPDVYRFNVFSREGEWLFGQDLPFDPDVITENGLYLNSEDEAGNPVIHFYRWVDGRRG